MTSTVDRHIRPFVEEALSDTRIVVIQGARQVGKTTLMRRIVEEREGHMVTFDDDTTRTAAAADPVGFLEQAPDRLLAIDELQRVPEMTLALKLVVDKDPRPGRFLVTGSANLLQIPGSQDSLAGRAESFELHGFSQGEIAGVKERFVERLLSGEEFLGRQATNNRSDYLQRALSGSYPEALARPAGRRRDRWLSNYVTRVLERDAADISSLQRIGDLPFVLRLLAARNGAELNVAEVARDAGIPGTSLRPLIGLLETLYLVQSIPAWSTNLTKRVVSRPKVALLDTGLAGRLINVSPDGASPVGDPQLAGALLEGFVAGEIRRQLTWAEESARLSHFRDRSGAEVDLVLETPDGRVAGIEIKASSSPTPRDARWLAQMRDKLGRRFVAGVVLHTGKSAVPMGDKISAVPLESLWAA